MRLLIFLWLHVSTHRGTSKYWHPLLQHENHCAATQVFFFPAVIAHPSATLAPAQNADGVLLPGCCCCFHLHPLPQVTDIRLITDRHTKRSKGLAYVEFSKQEEVFIALALTGQILLGQPVMVKPAEAEKNLAWEAQQAAKQSSAAEAELAALGLAPAALGAMAAPAGPLKLQVTGFKKGLTEKEIQQIFEPFGPVDNVMVVRDGAGAPIDIAYVVFRSALDGENARVRRHKTQSGVQGLHLYLGTISAGGEEWLHCKQVHVVYCVFATLTHARAGGARQDVA